jgi:hypothetical protein
MTSSENTQQQVTSLLTKLATDADDDSQYTSTEVDLHVDSLKVRQLETNDAMHRYKLQHRTGSDVVLLRNTHNAILVTSHAMFSDAFKVRI